MVLLGRKNRQNHYNIKITKIDIKKKKKKHDIIVLVVKKLKRMLLNLE